jgi:hypothetical protein
MKLLLWLARWVVRSAVIAGLSLFSAWFVVNMYVESMLHQFQLSNVGKKIQFSDVLARLGEDWHIIKGRPDSEAAEGRTAPVAAQPAAPGGTTGSENRAGGGSGDAPGGQPSATEEKVPEDAVAVSGRLSQSGASSSGTASGGGTGSGGAGQGLDGLVVSADDFAKKKAAMSNEDKMKLFSLLAGKLPPDQLQRLSVLVEDGITSDEMKQIDAILQKYFSKEDYNQIVDIIKKY